MDSPVFINRVGIHKHLGARKKTGSELVFLQINFKISFFPFLQMLFTAVVCELRAEKVSAQTADAALGAPSLLMV